MKKGANDKSKDIGLQAAEVKKDESLPRRDIYLGHIKPTKTIYNVHTHLRLLNADKGAEVVALRDKDDWKSFKVSVDSSLYEKLLDANLWPKGITVNPFMQKVKPTRRDTHGVRRRNVPHQGGRNVLHQLAGTRTFRGQRPGPRDNYHWTRDTTHENFDDSHNYDYEQNWRDDSYPEDSYYSRGWNGDHHYQRWSW